MNISTSDTDEHTDDIDWVGDYPTLPLLNCGVETSLFVRLWIGLQYS